MRLPRAVSIVRIILRFDAVRSLLNNDNEMPNTFMTNSAIEIEPSHTFSLFWSKDVGKTFHNEELNIWGFSYKLYLS